MIDRISRRFILSFDKRYTNNGIDPYEAINRKLGLEKIHTVNRLVINTNEENKEEILLPVIFLLNNTTPNEPKIKLILKYKFEIISGESPINFSEEINGA